MMVKLYEKDVKLRQDLTWSLLLGFACMIPSRLNSVAFPCKGVFTALKNVRTPSPCARLMNLYLCENQVVLQTHISRASSPVNMTQAV